MPAPGVQQNPAGMLWVDRSPMALDPVRLQVNPIQGKGLVGGEVVPGVDHLNGDRMFAFLQTEEPAAEVGGNIPLLLGEVDGWSSTEAYLPVVEIDDVGLAGDTSHLVSSHPMLHSKLIDSRFQINAENQFSDTLGAIVAEHRWQI